MIDIIFSYLELCKPRISLFAASSALSGFLLVSSGFRQQVIYLMIGVLALASGACALNQYQEQETDALMPRTRRRPIPSGRIRPGYALSFSVVLISLGMAILLQIEQKTVALLGLFAVIWYNGIYTYLKKTTAFAAVPGAVAGAVPPVMGAVAGGGRFEDPSVIFLCFFFFIWQIPHFWLLFAAYGEEYRLAGLPSLAGIFTDAQFARVIFNWLVAAAVSCLFIVLSSASLSSPMCLFVLASSLWLIWKGTKLLRKEKRSLNNVFRSINLYMLIVMAIFSFNRVLA